MEYLLCKKPTGNKKKLVFPNFIIKCFLGLTIGFYEEGFIGYILGEEREGRRQERREGQVDQNLFAVTMDRILIFILIFQVLLKSKTGKIKD